MFTNLAIQRGPHFVEKTQRLPHLIHWAGRAEQPQKGATAQGRLKPNPGRVMCKSPVDFFKRKLF
jgi:hypothetical protein